MSDLTSLFQFSPEVAAYFTGQNQASKQASDQLNNQTLAQALAIAAAKEQRDAELFPLTKQGKQAELDKSAAELPGIAADSRKKITAADVAAGTMQSDVDAGNTDNRMKIYKQLGQHLGTLSTAIDNTPGVSPHLTLAQQLAQMQIPEGAKQGLLQKYANVPPAQLSARLKADGMSILKETPAYQQAMDVETLQGKNRLAVANTQVAGQKAIEQMRIDAGKYNKKNTAVDVNTALLKYGHSAAAVAEIYAQAAQIADAAGDTAEATRYSQLAQQARQRAAEDAGNKGLARPGIDTSAVSGLPPQARPQATAPIGVPGGAPPAPAGAMAGPNFEAAAKAAWGSYDPNKYDYRVGPNGQLQRKAK